jgi:hypothetical protein
MERLASALLHRIVGVVERVRVFYVLVVGGAYPFESFGVVGMFALLFFLSECEWRCVRCGVLLATAVD